MKKINFFESSFLIVLFLSIYLTFDYNWWSSGNLKVHDYIFLPILFTTYFFLKDKFFIFLALLFSSLLINIESFNVLFSLFLLSFCSLNLGHYIVNERLKYESYFLSIENFAVGLALISTIIFCFSFFKINYPLLYLIIFLTPSIIIFYKKNFKSFYLDTLNYKNSNLNKYSLFIICFLFIYYFSAVSLDETSHDAVSHHLTIPYQMYLNNHWGYDVNNYVWAAVQHGSQWIFTFLYFFGQEKAIKFFLFLIVLLSSIYIYSILNKKFNNKKYSLYASLIYLSLPINLYLLRGIFVDILHSFIFLSIIILLIENKKNKWPIISILIGFCFAIKSSTIIIIPLVLFLYIRECFLEKKIDFKNFFFLICLFLIFGAGSYINAFVITGSPTFPLYNEIFKSDLISKDAFYHPFYSQTKLNDFFEISLNSKKYGEFINNGAIGLVLLILPISILFLKKKEFFETEFISVIGIIIGCVIMFQFQAYLRYIYFLIPSVLILFFLIIHGKIKNFKILNFALCLILLVNCLKFDKISSELPNNYKLYFSKQKNNEFFFNGRKLQGIAKIINSEERFKGKRVLILSHNNDPIFYKFNMPVYFYSWHSIDFFKNIVKIGNLNKTMDLMKIDYIVYNNEHTVSNFENIFRDNPKDFTDKQFELYGFTVAKNTYQQN